MNALTWDAAAGAFVLQSADRELLQTVHTEHGWGPTAAPDKLYTRTDYAALAFYEDGDDVAKGRLARLANEYRQSYDDGRGMPAYAVPDDLELMPFQNAGVWYALNRPHAVIGDQMGLGKTAQAIVTANELQAERVLCVVPATVRRQWQREILRWSTAPGLSTYLSEKSSDGIGYNNTFQIISFDLCRNEGIFRALMKTKWDLLIIDECHYLKTVDSTRTRQVFGGLQHLEEALADRARKVIGLTGTPLPNRPRECYTMLRHLCWEAIDFQSEEAFKRRYNPEKPMWERDEIKGRLPELRARLRCNLMVRRLKRQVMKQLPKEFWELTNVEPNGAIRKVLKHERLLDVNIEQLEQMDMETRGHIATVRKEMGIAKAPRVVEHVKMVLTGGVEKVVIFTYHRDVHKIVADGLASHDPSWVIGGMTPGQKDKAVQRFIHDPRCRVFVAQIEVGGTGLDGLQEVCDRAVFAEPSWVPKDMEQAISRLHRTGQRSSVLGQVLVAPDSLDEKVLGSMLKKMAAIEETLDG